jgi:hypothetical protein
MRNLIWKICVAAPFNVLELGFSCLTWTNKKKISRLLLI